MIFYMSTIYPCTTEWKYCNKSIISATTGTPTWSTTPTTVEQTRNFDSSWSVKCGLIAYPIGPDINVTGAEFPLQVSSQHNTTLADCSSEMPVTIGWDPDSSEDDRRLATGRMVICSVDNTLETNFTLDVLCKCKITIMHVYVALLKSHYLQVLTKRAVICIALGKSYAQDPTTGTRLVVPLPFHFILLSLIVQIQPHGIV